MPDLSSSLANLTETFVTDVLAAIRAASLDDLVADVRVSASTPRANGTPPTRSAPKTEPSGHLARRRPEQVAKMLGDVHALLRAKGAMRSEDIREALNLDRHDLPRVLKLGLEHKTFRSKGVKRSTTYSVAS